MLKALVGAIVITLWDIFTLEESDKEIIFVKTDQSISIDISEFYESITLEILLFLIILDVYFWLNKATSSDFSFDENV